MDSILWLLFAAAAAIALGLALFSKRQIVSLRKRLADSEEKNRQLSRLEPILDAEGHAELIVKEASSEAERIEQAARLEATSLRAETDAVVAAARSDLAESQKRVHEDLKALRLRADSHLQAASAEAERIIEEANRQAEEIAGDAHLAAGNVRLLEQTAQAMKNIIEGYGDRYVIPIIGFLDEFGDQFGHTEAGQLLKSARDRVRQLAREGSAATCDYVEDNRRTTAVAFVLDAFNGKAESILAQAKHDNLGTLEQKLRDAYALVNHNGRAFRNARIENRYFEARLDELRWAVSVHELKVREREEQRELRERIREEEKAQREYERAIREAAKEEELLRKAMEKAQRGMEEASAEQKEKFEAQLAELKEKLRVAEEKNQRALSMAQQTRAGHVYVISNVGSFGEDVFKIGMTRRLEPSDRVRELSGASVPFDFEVHAMIPNADAPAFERSLHRTFLEKQVNKVNQRKEFFRVPITEIRRVIESMGIEASWTMVAESRVYKESLAIEETLREGGIEAEKWRAQQLRGQERLLQEVEEEREVA